MDVHRTYGVEIELCASKQRSSVAALLRSALQPLGHRCATQGYTHQTDESNTTEWYAETDGSLRSTSAEHPNTMEIKTPVLKGVEGLKALKVVSSALGSVGHINKSCGLHVHHYIKEEERRDHLRNLCHAWLENEKFFMMCVPPSRHSSSYCKQWANQHPSGLTATVDPVEWFYNNFGRSNSRTSTLNLLSVRQRGTVEFRLHSGTYEFEKIANWIISTQRFVIKAMRGDFIFQKAHTFDEFIGHMETDFDPASLTASIERLPEVQRQPTASPTELTMALVHPDAKKKKLPRPGTKAHTIATMLLSGATKRQLVNALDEQHGAIGEAKQQKFVSGQLTNMKNPKYSWGFRIQKNRTTGLFRIVPHELPGHNPVAPRPAAPTAEDSPQVLRMASKLDLRSLHWLKSRRAYFDAQRSTQRREAQGGRRRSRRRDPLQQQIDDLAEAVLDHEE